MIDFKVTREDADLISQIVRRARGMEYVPDPMVLSMDITACHANGCPLELKRLLEADAFNFIHDVFGIVRHINRETGHLDNAFLPRTARREPVTA